MSKFWELMEESVIVSGAIALSCVGSVVYLACLGKPIPDILVNVTMIVVGFFFGGKVQQAQNVIATRMKK